MENSNSKLVMSPSKVRIRWITKGHLAQASNCLPSAEGKNEGLLSSRMRPTSTFDMDTPSKSCLQSLLQRELRTLKRQNQLLVVLSPQLRPSVPAVFRVPWMSPTGCRPAPGVPQMLMLSVQEAKGHLRMCCLSSLHFSVSLRALQPLLWPSSQRHRL